jgi:hypothetical protein
VHFLLAAFHLVHHYQHHFQQIYQNYSELPDLHLTLESLAFVLPSVCLLTTLQEIRAYDKPHYIQGNWRLFAHLFEIQVGLGSDLKSVLFLTDEITLDLGLGVDLFGMLWGFADSALY